jgi:hypothetical protein
MIAAVREATPTVNRSHTVTYEFSPDHQDEPYAQRALPSALLRHHWYQIAVVFEASHQCARTHAHAPLFSWRSGCGRIGTA